jgi:putative ABC transport system permease protein
MAGGVLLFGAFSASHAVHPSPWALLGLAVAALAVTGALAALPARLEARRSIASVLRAP